MRERRKKKEGKNYQSLIRSAYPPPPLPSHRGQSSLDASHPSFFSLVPYECFLIPAANQNGTPNKGKQFTRGEYLAAALLCIPVT